MHELTVTAQTHGIELLLEQVLDSLHIVVGDTLDLLHVLGILHVKRRVEVAQRVVCRLGDITQLRQRKPAQGDEILDLDIYAVADKCELRKIIRQHRRYLIVPAVHRRNG